MRVAIVGGGVMGCACAEALAQRELEVVVLERAVPGAEASSAAAGILGAQIEPDASLRPMLVQARALYRDWSSALRESTGVDVGYRRSGALRVVFDEAEALGLEPEVARHKADGLRADLLSAPDVGRIEPAVSPEVLGGVHFPDEAQVDPRALLRALIVRIARLGVETRTGIAVRALHFERDACRGVLLGDEVLPADAVVLAAGSWSSLVGGVPDKLPKVTPVRGQIALLEERPPRLRSIVVGPRGYVVPRGDGRVLAGSTEEHVGFERRVTAAGIAEILTQATLLVPHLGSAELASTWSSFRPLASAPMLGASSVPGLFLATGHFKNGILLAKHTAEVVATAVAGS